MLARHDRRLAALPEWDDMERPNGPHVHMRRFRDYLIALHVDAYIATWTSPDHERTQYV
jgi:hypothetical protein